MHDLRLGFLTSLMMCVLFFDVVSLRAWQADNGDGSFTNPLFYDEFSDPDLIRVGDDFYLTGTTMHAMPGLPVLHSKDLVNWELLGYALDKLDLGPEFRLEGGKEIYGQGIWAPSFRYHKGTYYIFSNVNHRKTQLFTATNPARSWTHTEPTARSTISRCCSTTAARSMSSGVCESARGGFGNFGHLHWEIL